MTLMPWDGPPWFAKLFPNGMSVSFGPEDDRSFFPPREPTKFAPPAATRFTALEAAVLALVVTHGRSDEWLLEHVPVTPAVLARVKGRLQAKYRLWERWYWEEVHGVQVLKPGGLKL